MKKLLDYLLLKTPTRKKTQPGGVGPAPGKISPSRILWSMLGLLLGIVFSFVVSGLVQDQPVDAPAPATQAAVESVASPESSPPAGVRIGPKVKIPEPQELLVLGLIAIAVFLLSFPALYFTLGLYENTHGFIVLFVAFQYGYFWQSVIKGGATFFGQ